MWLKETLHTYSVCQDGHDLYGWHLVLWKKQKSKISIITLHDGLGYLENHLLTAKIFLQRHYKN